LDRQKAKRLFRSFKRGIAAGPILEPRIIDGVPWTDREAGRYFLRELLRSIPIPPAEIEQLVVTVPVAAFEGYMLWLSQAMREDLSERIRIVDESTAAALGYAITEPDALVMVVDLGGGSLDLSLVRLPESRERTGSLLGRLLGKQIRQNTAQVIAKTGINLGGSDIDQWLLAEVLARTRLRRQDLGQEYPGLLVACEEAKIRLSRTRATEIEFETGDGQRHSVPIQRAELEALLEKEGFYATLRQAVERVMGTARRSGIFHEDIHHVLLVGGLSLMPSIQQTLQRQFQGRALRVEKPFTAVAEGALLVATGFGLEDHLAHSYGLRYLDPETGEHWYDEIIPMGSHYPTKRPVAVVLSAAHPNQETVEFVIGQIDTEAVSMVEVSYEGGVTAFVAQADRGAQQITPLNQQDAAPKEGGPTMVQLAPPGLPGEDRLRAEFRVDEDRQLRLSVFDLQRGERLLEDAVVVKLEARPSQFGDRTGSTGREPWPSSQSQPGRHRLSLRGLASILNLLPPESISLDAVTAALHSADCTARYSAAEQLSRRGDRDARRIMQQVLETGTAPERASVAYHLHRLSWFGAEPLLRRALQDEDERVRESAVFALCRISAQKAYDLLAEALPAEGDMVRMAAALGLDRCRDARAVPVLQIALQARDPKVQEMALESLGITGVPEALPIVRQAMGDPDLGVRYAATLSLLELAGENCFPELAGLILDSQGLERWCLLRGLFHATNYLHIDVARSSSAGVLIEALQVSLLDDLPETRVAAAMPLMRMDHEAAWAVLREAFRREEDGETKGRMLHYAVLLGSGVGDEFLQDALRSSDDHVRETAEDLAEYLACGGQPIAPAR
jgi:HEAT repeat protein/actin-like ATPase involved in cell morphogenesis